MWLLPHRGRISLLRGNRGTSGRSRRRRGGGNRSGSGPRGRYRLCRSGGLLQRSTTIYAHLGVRSGLSAALGTFAFFHVRSMPFRFGYVAHVFGRRPCKAARGPLTAWGEKHRIPSKEYGVSHRRPDPLPISGRLLCLHSHYKAGAAGVQGFCRELIKFLGQLHGIFQISVPQMVFLQKMDEKI